MATIILGQDLVFWSGILAGTSFVLLMLTCSVSLDCMRGVCSHKERAKLFGAHRYFIWSSMITVAIHLVIALHASLLHVYF